MPSPIATALAHRVPGYILDVGSPERYARAEADLRDGRFVVVAGQPQMR